MKYFEKIIYLPFKLKSNRNHMDRTKFLYIIASEIGWTNPEEADKILQIAVEEKILEKNICKEHDKHEYTIKKDIDTSLLSSKNIEFDFHKFIKQTQGFRNPKNDVEETVNFILKNTDIFMRKEIIKNINKIKKENDCDIKEACDKYVDQHLNDS